MKLLAITTLMLATSVSSAMDTYSSYGEFNAPTIYGRTNYTNAQDGAIVLTLATVPSMAKFKEQMLQVLRVGARCLKDQTQLEIFIAQL